MSRGLHRQIERELTRGLGRKRRHALIERLRGNAEQRRSWDRAVTAMRALERREVSRFEIDQVERWLFEDLEAEAVTAPARSRTAGVWTMLAAAASLAVTAAALVWIGHDDDTRVAMVERDTDGDLVARGRASERPLAIELLCGQPPRSAATRGCGRDELLGFSVRLGTEDLAPAAASSFARAPLFVSLFGIDEAGELLYYAPTPDDPARMSVQVDEPWQALPLSVRLGVNHEPGTVRVFALASDVALDVSELDELVRELAPQRPAGVDDLAWHLRLSPSTRARVCPEPDRCASAETLLRITSED